MNGLNSSFLSVVSQNLDYPGCTIWCRFIQSAIRRMPSLRRMVVSIWIGEPRKLSIPNQLNGTGFSVSILRNNAL